MCTQTVRDQEDVKSHWLHFGIPHPAGKIMLIICSTAAFVILHGKGNHLHKSMLLHLLHLLHLQPLSLQLGAVHGVAQLYDGLPPCHELQLTVTFTFQFKHLSCGRRKNLGGN